MIRAASPAGIAITPTTSSPTKSKPLHSPAEINVALRPRKDSQGPPGRAGWTDRREGGNHRRACTSATSTMPIGRATITVHARERNLRAARARSGKETTGLFPRRRPPVGRDARALRQAAAEDADHPARALRSGQRRGSSRPGRKPLVEKPRSLRTSMIITPGPEG